jgi:hypothetical protein
MNRKNLTAAVLAGLAGVAGLAGTAQAVNLNPDGLGQILIYPYYTTNDGNQTILSVVNTTDQAKAVKVRFREGYNSREVLDFNLYLSKYDVWVAAIAEGPHVTGTPGVPTLYIGQLLHGSVPVRPRHCRWERMGRAAVPALRLPGKTDGGPTDISAPAGYMQMIEMGTLTNGSARPTRRSAATGPPGFRGRRHHGGGW